MGQNYENMMKIMMIRKIKTKAFNKKTDLIKRACLFVYLSIKIINCNKVHTKY